jgi:hypothetical protein
MTMEAVIEEQDHLADEIQRCSTWIQNALDKGGNSHEVHDIERMIRNDNLQFWAADDACIVTEFIPYPNYTVLHVFLAGGSLERIQEMRPDVESFGRHFGCKKLTISGRLGWIKVLGPFGYKPGLQAVSLEL